MSSTTDYQTHVGGTARPSTDARAKAMCSQLVRDGHDATMQGEASVYVIHHTETDIRFEVTFVIAPYSNGTVSVLTVFYDRDMTGDDSRSVREISLPNDDQAIGAVIGTMLAVDHYDGGPLWNTDNVTQTITETEYGTQYVVKTDTFAVAWLDLGRTNDHAMPVSFHWVDTGTDIPASWPGEPACEYLDDQPCRCDAGYRMGSEVNDLLATGGPDTVIAYLTERHKERS